MNPALWPRDRPLDAALMTVDPAAGTFGYRRLADLAELLRTGDLLVMNDSATLPASLRGRTRKGDAVELRLASVGPEDTWSAVLFGAGNWRTRTEDRPSPPRLAPSDDLLFEEGLSATVVGVSPEWPRFIEVRFDRSGAELWQALYRAGRPVQYAHLAGSLRLWHVQTAYASRPWSVEAPSAGLALNWALLGGLGQRGVELAFLTHGAGLSSTGDAAIDAALPLAEHFDVPESTVRAVEQTRRTGRRVVAVGTTVVRALEGAASANGGELRPGEGVTSLVLTETHRLRVVDGILTGIHDPAASHYRLLQAFAPASLLKQAYSGAEERGFLGHEFGDAMLILPQ